MSMGRNLTKHENVLIRADDVSEFTLLFTRQFHKTNIKIYGYGAQFVRDVSYCKDKKTICYKIRPKGYDQKLENSIDVDKTVGVFQ